MKYFLAAATFIVGFHVWALYGAQAHEAPTGWTYDYTCCSLKDCRPVDGPNAAQRHHSEQILETKNGYRVVRASGKTEDLAWNDKRVRISKDEGYHICTSVGMADSMILCIYVPNKGF